MVQKLISEQLSDRFPDYKSQINNLLLKNSDFFEIAQDYEFCRNKLNRLSANQTENEPLVRHYRQAMSELEEEMMGYFSKTNK